MIKQVHIKNFKCFSRPTHIDLAEITVCAGMNSVGKSSLIQALLLLRQSFEAMEKYRGGTDDTYSVLLNHSYDLHLGSVDQIRSSRDTNVITMGADSLRFRYESSQDQLSLRFHTPADLADYSMCS